MSWILSIFFAFCFNNIVKPKFGFLNLLRMYVKCDINIFNFHFRDHSDILDEEVIQSFEDPFQTFGSTESYTELEINEHTEIEIIQEPIITEDLSQTKILRKEKNDAINLSIVEFMKNNSSERDRKDQRVASLYKRAATEINAELGISSLNSNIVKLRWQRLMKGVKDFKTNSKLTGRGAKKSPNILMIWRFYLRGQCLNLRLLFNQ